MPQIDIIEIGRVAVATTQIPDNDRTTRRQRESEAVAAILQCLSSLVGSTLPMSHDVHGAPVIQGWHVSVTHSMGLAAVALCQDHPIGIDAEDWRQQLQRVKQRFLAPDELPRVTSDPDLLLTWTIKEAVFKAHGRHDLPFTSIITSPDLKSARADDVLYRIVSISTYPHALTLAIPALST